ncbi:DUF2834 domain-containing protein [Brevundimonas fontaquae]|uniref:DUF2834 domain-containing protein n=1 Tax=Brevundimonas fontaquae TaxID=2813778 RepID=A0ABX7LSV5_9CAUL|nr:DUF2834 domain-containing protein [Brevundimonas fontaquae]QSF54810.1 DUF2834 domain-containing protein [Brevundimonas fontaquae]
MTRSMMLRSFYLAAAVVGTVVPWGFFASYFAVSGIEATGIIRNLFNNGAASGFVSDVLISILVFWVWSWGDAMRNGVKYWWLVIPAGFFVGLSLAMPLYFFFREVSTGPDVRLTRQPR